MSQGTRLALQGEPVTFMSLRPISQARAAASRQSGARPRRDPRSRARGFTIPELLAVVIIIGIFAAAASPMFINVMRDRRVNRFGMEVTSLYRLARSRALGRGTAVLVRWDAAASMFYVREATTTVALGPPLSGNCTGTDWNNAAQYRELNRLHFGSVPYELVTAAFWSDGGVSQAAADLCFTSGGRSYVRYTAGGSFAPMTGVPYVTVTNNLTTLERRVLIPPSGVARMAL